MNKAQIKRIESMVDAAINNYIERIEKCDCVGYRTTDFTSAGRAFVENEAHGLVMSKIKKAYEANPDSFDVDEGDVRNYLDIVIDEYEEHTRIIYIHF